MATKVTPEIIEEINELYAELGVKAQVARKVGVSPATVTKYLIPNYIPKADRVITTCNEDISLPYDLFMGEYGQLGHICKLSEEELADLKELQKEVVV